MISIKNMKGLVIVLMLSVAFKCYSQKKDYQVIDSMKVESSFEVISLKEYDDAYGYILNEKTFKPVSIQVKDSIHNFVAAVHTKTKKWYNIDGIHKEFMIPPAP